MDLRHCEFIPRDDIYLFNIGEAQMAWLCFGCHWIDELKEFRFIVWAPNARSISLVGDFNGWNPQPMAYEEGGVWAAFRGDAQHGHHYKYQIVGADGRTVLKADPCAQFNQNRSETASIVWNQEEFCGNRPRCGMAKKGNTQYENGSSFRDWWQILSPDPSARSRKGRILLACGQ